MKLVYLANFDPINNRDIEILTKYSQKYEQLIIVPINNLSGFESIADISNRIEMLEIVRNEFNLNYIIEKLDDEDTFDIIKSLLFLRDKYGEIEVLLTGNNNIFFKPHLNEFEFHQGILGLNKENKIFLVEPLIELKTELGEVNILKFGTIDVPKCVYDYIIDNKLYFVAKLFKMLDLERFKHSVSVANLCYTIAETNTYNDPHEVNKAFIAGLLHDCGKDIPNELTNSLMHRYFIQDCSLLSYCYHQFIGSFLLTKEFGIEDKDIILAVKYHCTGRKNMTFLEKIVYSADKIDPFRGYDSKKMIKACHDDINKGFLMVLRENYNYLVSKGSDTSNHYSEECFKFYLGDIK